MPTPTILRPDWPKVQEAEIRCYRHSADRCSYELFFMLDDGTSWQSGVIDTWAEAVHMARIRARLYSSPEFFTE
jgi:hypothetical protein